MERGRAHGSPQRDLWAFFQEHEASHCASGRGRDMAPPWRLRRGAKVGEADGVAQAVASEGLEGAAVAGWDGHEVVDREAGVVPGKEQSGPVLVQQAFALEEADHLVPEELLGGGRIDVRHGHPLTGGGPPATGDERVYVRVEVELVAERLSGVFLYFLIFLTPH
jgi:hypothetical protein